MSQADIREIRYCKNHLIYGDVIACFKSNIEKILYNFDEHQLDYVAFDKERVSLRYNRNQTFNEFLNLRNKNLPYFSSLKISLWNAEYLKSCLLQKFENIWAKIFLSVASIGFEFGNEFEFVKMI